MDLRTSIKSNATNREVVRWMDFLSQLGSYDPQIYRLAQKFLQEKDPVKSAFDYAYKNIAYVPDPTDTQQLRTVGNMLRLQMGNCVDYVIFLSSVLRAMSVDHYFRRIGYDFPKRFAHIYVVTKDGIVLDPVITQKQDGSDTLHNRPEPMYNTEVSYAYKLDRFIKTC